MSLLNPHQHHIIRRTLQLFTLVALLSVGFALPARSASAAINKPSLRNVVSPNMEIKSHHSPNLCLDADLNTMANNGTKVQLWTCNGTSEQSWAVQLNTDLTTVTIWSNHYPYRCLDADLNTIGQNGTKMQLWDCNNSLQQSWSVSGNPDVNALEYANLKSGRCLDADLNTIGQNGGKAQLWDCHYTSQQTWTGSDGRGY